MSSGKVTFLFLLNLYITYDLYINIQGGAISKLLHFVNIFAKYCAIFTVFSSVNFVRKLLLSGIHTTHTYYVATLPCKT